jgi:hypothetical protein
LKSYHLQSMQFLHSFWYTVYFIQWSFEMPFE